MIKIFGLQKLTLLDFPGKVACTLFTGGCNFRCPFCHNAELLHASLETALEEADVLAFLRKRAKLLDGVCVSGGEPLLHEDLGELLRMLRQMGYLIKLDTNGSRPEALQALVAQGLVDYVAMDIKNAPDKYPQTIGLADYDLRGFCENRAMDQRGQALLFAGLYRFGRAPWRESTWLHICGNAGISGYFAADYSADSAAGRRQYLVAGDDYLGILLLDIDCFC